MKLLLNPFCLGNICRSPIAEAVFRQKSSAVAPNIRCDSAETADWRIGSPRYQPMQEAAFAQEINMSKLRARQVSIHDFKNFDLIIVMDQKQSCKFKFSFSRRSW